MLWRNQFLQYDLRTKNTAYVTHHDKNIILAELTEFSVKKQVNKTIPFLKCFTNKMSENQVNTTVCKAKTHIGQYTHFHSSLSL